MTFEEFRKVLERSGFPVAYHSSPEREVPPMPYIIYMTPYSNNFKADGRVYSSSRHVQVELYTPLKDINAEEKVEKALEEYYFDKMETGVDGENCYEVIYELEV